MIVCYVILHYKNIKDTIKCMESLFETASSNSVYIIVDNGSNDGSGEKLQELYRDTKSCRVLCLKENMGFSRGNNAGYKIAKDEYHPDYIVVTNNDVVFYQNDFEEKINKVHKETQFDVLGPDIFVPRHNDHQSPLFKNAITVEQLEKEIAEYERYEQNPKSFSHRLRIHAFKNMLCSNIPFIRKLYAALRGKDDLDYKKQYENVGLQGSCLIVSKTYIENEDKMFSPEPFLYCEEIFLYYRCKKKGYKMVYSPKLGIRHEEAASIKNANNDSMQHLKFMLHHHVIARKQLLEYLKEMD